MKNCVCAGVVVAMVGISCVAKAQAPREQGPSVQKDLPWSISGIDRAPDGTVYMVSDVDNALYRYTLNETSTHNRTPMLVKKAEPITLPVTYAGGETKSGLESVRYVNDSTFLFAVEYDKPDGASASSLYMGMLHDTTMTLTEIVPDSCFPATWPDNSGIEAMTLSADGKSIWIANERPFTEDTAAHTNRVVRLTHLDFSGKVLGQIAYSLQSAKAFTEPGAYADNGVSEIMAYDDTHLLILERAFAGVETCRTYGRVFMLDLTASHPYTGCEPAAVSYTGKLVFDAGKAFFGAHIDNYEGLTWGPVRDGRRTLMLLSDDNGNWTRHVCPQSTDLILFSIH